MKRPTRQETESDLLKQQEELLGIRVKEAKPSIFAQQRAQRKASSVLENVVEKNTNEKDVVQAPLMNTRLSVTGFPIARHRFSRSQPTGSQTVTPRKAEPKTGFQSFKSETEDLYRGIHDGNLRWASNLLMIRKLASMSEEDIRHFKQEMLEKLDPSFLAMIKKRAEARKLKSGISVLFIYARNFNWRI